MSQSSDARRSGQPPARTVQASAANGLGARRRRLSDAETARRMLDAALAIVERVGLTVSLEHLSLEEVIREAGVARSAVYRRWPYKDQFYADLLREVARAASPVAVVEDEARLEPVRRAVRGARRRMQSAAGRRELVVELLRIGTSLDFDAIYGSREWRTYLAVHAAVSSLTDSDLRDEMHVLLAQSEERFVSRLSARYAVLTELFGMQVREELDVTLDDLALMASSMLRGLVLSALVWPEVANVPRHARPAGAAAAREWSLSGLALLALLDSFLVTDTDDWSRERAATVERSLLEALSAL